MQHSEDENHFRRDDFQTLNSFTAICIIYKWEAEAKSNLRFHHGKEASRFGIHFERISDISEYTNRNTSWQKVLNLNKNSNVLLDYKVKTWQIFQKESCFGNVERSVFCFLKHFYRRVCVVCKIGKRELFTICNLCLPVRRYRTLGVLGDRRKTWSHRLRGTGTRHSKKLVPLRRDLTVFLSNVLGDTFITIHFRWQYGEELPFRIQPHE